MKKPRVNPVGWAPTAKRQPGAAPSKARRRACSHCSHIAPIVVVVKKGEHYCLRVGPTALRRNSGLDAVRFEPGQVQEGLSGVELGRPSVRLPPIGGLAHT